MAKDFAKNFYNSPRWRRAASAYKSAKFGICERCNRPKGCIVHHKIYLTPHNIHDDSIALNPANFELLCRECHNKEHFENLEPTRDDVYFDESGQLVKKPNITAI